LKSVEDGVEIYAHMGLLQVGPAARVSLGGFWRLRWLKVHGVAGHSACAL